jgi:outer membrane murein-binding lipoprotein Lpp
MYIDRMAEQLKQLTAKIDSLEAGMRDTAADVKIGLESKVVELRYKRAELADKLQALRESSDAAWLTLKDGVELAWHDLRTAFTDARGRFKRAA